MELEGGRWGLVIIASAFFIQVFAFGLSTSIGVYNIHFLDYFDNDTMGVSLIAALNWAVFLGSGPLASFLMKKMSCRKIALTGSALVTLGVGLMPLLPYLPALCISFGVIAGIGSGLVYVPSHLLTALYYERHQSLATGIATSGSGLGGVIMPIVFGRLIEFYGWRGSLVIACGLMSHLFICSALLRSAPKKKKYKIGKESTTLLDRDKSTGEGSSDVKKEQNSLFEQGNSKGQTPEVLPNDSRVVLADNKNGTVRTSATSEVLPLAGDVDGFELNISDSVHKLEEGSTTLLDKWSQKPLGDSSVTLSDEKHGVHLVRKLSHIYLFTDLGFSVYFVSSIMWNFAGSLLMAFGPEYTTKHGISNIDSALLLTLFGLGDFLGGIIGAVLGNIWTKHRLMMYVFACISFGVCVGAAPLGNTFADFTAILVCAGLVFGMILGLLVVVLIDIIGSDSLGDGLGYIMLANGIGAFGGPAFAGYVYNVTGSYDLAFNIGGVFGILAGVSMFLIPLCSYLFPSLKLLWKEQCIKEIVVEN